MELVRGVLADLVESGLVFAAGPTKTTSFRAASDSELGAMAKAHDQPVDLDLVWALVFRLGPLTATQLSSLGRFDPVEIEAALDSLVRAGRVARDPDTSGGTYRTSHFFVPVGAASGWEAAVFDHFHAVVRTICEKLRRANESTWPDRVGGSTYSFEIWDGHPLYEEVMGHLRRFREAQSGLRERVRAYNATCAKPAARQGVVVYAGQTTWDVAHEGDGSNA